MGPVPDSYALSSGVRVPAQPPIYHSFEKEETTSTVSPFKETEKFSHEQDENVPWQDQLESENLGTEAITYVLGHPFI